MSIKVSRETRRIGPPGFKSPVLSDCLSEGALAREEFLKKIYLLFGDTIKTNRFEASTGREMEYVSRETIARPWQSSNNLQLPES